MGYRMFKADKNDDGAFRHPYGRHSDMSNRDDVDIHIPFFFNRGGAEINLQGQYKGVSAFMICNGPSFATLDHNLLKKPGIMTLGINNGPRTFRPNFWACVDDPTRFLKSIWFDPKITKFVPQTFFEKTIFDNGEAWAPMAIKVGECPNVVGFRRNEKFNAPTFLTEPTFNWGNHKDFGGCRSVMLPSLRILYLLGFRTVYLLGCDFKMTENYAYHFEEKREKGAVNCNTGTYKRLNEEYLPSLKPCFDQAGFQVFNCNPESGLTVFPYKPYEEAIQETIERLGDVDHERTWGLYAKPGSPEKAKAKFDKPPMSTPLNPEIISPDLRMQPTRPMVGVENKVPRPFQTVISNEARPTFIDKEAPVAKLTPFIGEPQNIEAECCGMEEPLEQKRHRLAMVADAMANKSMAEKAVMDSKIIEYRKNIAKIQSSMISPPKIQADNILERKKVVQKAKEEIMHPSCLMKPLGR